MKMNFNHQQRKDLYMLVQLSLKTKRKVKKCNRVFQKMRKTLEFYQKIMIMKS
uniref:Kinesin family member 20B n=1 Tax=Rousettus aegyptiacus TaxID=9407 RepID=A0A7J8GA47_ROUAE|nr:kinesin family member 20B [Rousettus aegyptiacus]